jgi:hypothetical protein
MSTTTTTIAAKFSNGATKLQVGTAACAVATALALPAVAAQADPAAPVITAPITQILHGGASLSPANLAQDINWWWASNPGSANPAAAAAVAAAAAPTIIFEFEPLAYIPAMYQDYIGRALNMINLETCVSGLGTKIGPYGKVTVSRGC